NTNLDIILNGLEALINVYKKKGDDDADDYNNLLSLYERVKKDNDYLNYYIAKLEKDIFLRDTEVEQKTYLEQQLILNLNRDVSSWNINQLIDFLTLSSEQKDIFSRRLGLTTPQCIMDVCEEYCKQFTASLENI
ncbi:MAG: hypothetical protein KC414_11640, partial [Romboutsia sp.]|nr:hypothetical protein [Romboutsia sp.]